MLQSISFISGHESRHTIENPSKIPETTKSKKHSALAVLGALFMIVLLIVVFRMSSPTRSVAAYCKVYKAENATLANAKGDTYAVRVFSHKSSDPNDFAKAFSELERVAPDDIRPDVKTLQKLFTKLRADPSQAISVGLSGIPAETSVKNWTDAHCR